MLTEKAAMTEAIINGAGYYYRAPITEMAENRSTTGYSIKKGLNTDPSQGPTLPSTTACVIFRAAEAYLNYMEADYELNHSLDAKVKDTGKPSADVPVWIPTTKRLTVIQI